MKAQRGFSLIEILVVLVILGLLVSIMAPVVLNRADEARVQKVYADFANIETALKLYRLDNFAYPTTGQGLEALVAPSTLDPQPRNFKPGGYLDRMPVDPWGRTYFYMDPDDSWDISGSGESAAAGLPYIYSLGADGLEGGDSQNADLSNQDGDRRN